MSELKTLARPYAAAAYQFARQHNREEIWLDMLGNIRSLLLIESVQKILRSPNTDTSSFLLMLEPFVEKALDQHGFNFLKLLIANHRLGLASIIFELFEAIKAEADGIVSVKITTAVALSTIEQNIFIEKLARQLGRKISPIFYVNDVMIAGAIICVGEEYVLDGSLKTQLERLKTKF